MFLYVSVDLGDWKNLHSLVIAIKADVFAI